MPIVVWDKSFEVSVAQFDEHHKKLFDLLNKTFDCFNSGADRTEIAGVLSELVDYSTFHFSAEERWMEARNYPGLSSQREEHGKFSARMIEFQKNFLDNKPDVTLGVLQFLETWLLNHILQSDADYGYLAKSRPHDSH